MLIQKKGPVVKFLMLFFRAKTPGINELRSSSVIRRKSFG